MPAGTHWSRGNCTQAGCVSRAVAALATSDDPAARARGQLSGLRCGVLTIGMDFGAWLVPPEHAV